MLNEFRFEIKEVRTWHGEDIYPFDHFGLMTSHVFVIKKVK